MKICKICNAKLSYGTGRFYCDDGVGDHGDDGVSNHGYSFHNDPDNKFGYECFCFTDTNIEYIILFYNNGTIEASKFEGEKSHFIKVLNSSFKPSRYNREYIIGLIEKMLLLK